MNLSCAEVGFFRPLLPSITRSSVRLYRYRLNHGAPFPWLRWFKQQSHHALDIDDQPGQQILTAVACSTAIPCPSAVVLPHHFGQFAFDRPMFPAHLLIARSSHFLASSRILCGIIVHDHDPAIRFGDVFQAAFLQWTRRTGIMWERIFPPGVDSVACAPLRTHSAWAGQRLGFRRMGEVLCREIERRFDSYWRNHHLQPQGIWILPFTQQVAAKAGLSIDRIWISVAWMVSS